MLVYIDDNTKEIGVLCHWYKLARNSPELVPVPMDMHGYINIQQYYLTTSPPVSYATGLKLETDIYSQIKKYF